MFIQIFIHNFSTTPPSLMYNLKTWLSSLYAAVQSRGSTPAL